VFILDYTGLTTTPTTTTTEVVATAATIISMTSYSVISFITTTSVPSDDISNGTPSLFSRGSLQYTFVCLADVVFL